MANTVRLQTNSVLQVPLQNFDKDFTFIVNGQSYKTNKFVADLISPEISNFHLTDSTINEYSFTTQHQGNFQHILDLLTFEAQIIEDSELSFFEEVITKLRSDKIKVHINDPEPTIDNIIELFHKHEQSPEFFSKKISEEIDFLSEHFSELVNKERENLSEMSIDHIERIISNDKLQLDNEDQLLKFINELSMKNDQYSILYEYVYFPNVETSTISEFLSIFDINLMNNKIWSSLSLLLKKSKIESGRSKLIENRYRKPIQKMNEIKYSHDNLNGIFGYFMNNSNIKEEVDVSCSSTFSGNSISLLDIENKSNDFYTDPLSNSWICFEFKKYLVVPSNYSIRSCYSGPGGCHLKNWVIEGSMDKKNWSKIDERNDCSLLNGSFYTHTFDIPKENVSDSKFKFLRIRQTGENWHGGDCLNICSVEFYGGLI